MKRTSFTIESIPRGWVLLVFGAASWAFVGVLVLSLRALFLA